MLTNVYATSNYDRLRIDKALGFRKADNNNKEHKNKRSNNNVRSLMRPKIQNSRNNFMVLAFL